MSTLDLFTEAVTLEDTDLLHLKRGTGANSDKKATGATIKSYFATAAQGAKVDFLTVTQPVDLDTIEARVNALDAAVVLKGSWDASVGTFPGGGTAQAGDSYIVSIAGTVDSIEFKTNDRIVALVDNAPTGVYATNWLKLDYSDAYQTNAEIEAAYNAQVAIVSQVIAEAGTSTTVYRWTPERVKQAIVALGGTPGGGGGLTPVFKSTNYTAAANEKVFCLTATAAAAFTITLPASPVSGESVSVWDAEDAAQDYNVTIARNGQTIQGAAEDFVLNVSGGRVDLAFDGTTWQLSYTTPGASAFFSEGTFTPTIQDASLSDGEGQTYSAQSGRYQKAGSVVTFWIDITVTSIGTLTAGNQVYIAGLPFLPNATAGVGVQYASGLSITADESLSGVIGFDTSQTLVRVYKWGIATGTEWLLFSNLAPASRFIITGQYTTDE